MKFERGQIVIIILQNPREKLLGVLDEITAAGVSLRAIDLEYFDDWSRAIAAGEPHLSMTDCFIPMWRVERITRDEANGEIPSMSQQFQQRTGRELIVF
jgi:hypothetical protein